MVEINRRYRVLKTVMVTIISPKRDADGEDTHSYLIDPGHGGEFSFNGNDIIYHSPDGKSYTTINDNSFIDAMLENGRLEPV